MSKPIVDLLNEALNVEYTIIVHYPRLVSMVHDKETKALVNALGSASVRHADVVARAIMRLGGTPSWTFEPFSFDDSLAGIFQRQLEKEETARKLHRETAVLAPDPSLRTEFEQIAREEESHIRTVKEILKRLEEQPQGAGGPRKPEFF